MINNIKIISEMRSFDKDKNLREWRSKKREVKKGGIPGYILY